MQIFTFVFYSVVQISPVQVSATFLHRVFLFKKVLPMNNGFIKLFRSIRYWEWYTDSKTLHLFLHVLLSANWKDNRWQGIDVKRGTLITSIESLSNETGLTKQEVRTRLTRLEKTGEINTRTNTRFTVITICNYDSYQQLEEEVNTPTNKPTTHHQHTTNTPLTTTKERKEEKERKEDSLTVIGEQHLEILSKGHNLDLTYIRTQMAVADEYYKEKGNSLTYAKLDAWLSRDPDSRKNPKNPNKVDPPYWQKAKI